MKLNKDNLVTNFAAAEEEGAKYIGILVTIPGSNENEVIIFPKEAFRVKLTYLLNTYNTNLKHNTAPLHIEGFTYGNSYAAIERDLVPQTPTTFPEKKTRFTHALAMEDMYMFGHTVATRGQKYPIIRLHNLTHYVVAANPIYGDELTELEVSYADKRWLLVEGDE